MSLQRIFEMVKRQGVPLVITDGQGKQPLIVLPLDTYEALLDNQEPPSDRGPIESLEPVIVPVGDDSAPSMAKVDDTSLSGQKSSNMSEIPKSQGLGTDLMSELSLEEHFYLDPIDKDKMG